MIPNAPCLNCPDRHESCHSHCEKYAEYKAERQKVLNRQHKDGMLRNNLCALDFARRTAWQRAWRDRKSKKERGEHK